MRSRCQAFGPDLTLSDGHVTARDEPHEFKPAPAALSILPAAAASSSPQLHLLHYYYYLLLFSSLFPTHSLLLLLQSPPLSPSLAPSTSTFSLRPRFITATAATDSPVRPSVLFLFRYHQPTSHQQSASLSSSSPLHFIVVAFLSPCRPVFESPLRALRIIVSDPRRVLLLRPRLRPRLRLGSRRHGVAVS